MTFSFQKQAEEELLNQLLYYRDIHQKLSQEFNLRVQETINRSMDFLLVFYTNMTRSKLIYVLLLL